MQSAADQEIIDFAAAEARVCVTLDRDFPQAVALTSASAPSVVLIRRQRLKSVSLAEILVLVWQRYSSLLDHGAVVTVRAHSMAARLLPLR